jgi:hypothetical protein
VSEFSPSAGIKNMISVVAFLKAFEYQTESYRTPKALEPAIQKILPQFKSLSVKRGSIHELLRNDLD